MKKAIIIILLVCSLLFLASCTFLQQEFGDIEIIGGQECKLLESGLATNTYTCSHDNCQFYANYDCKTVTTEALITFRTNVFRLQDYSTNDWVAILPQGGQYNLIGYKFVDADTMVQDFEGFNLIDTPFGQLHYRVDGNTLYLENGVINKDVPYLYGDSCCEKTCSWGGWRCTCHGQCSGIHDEHGIYKFTISTDVKIPTTIDPITEYSSRETFMGGYACTRELYINNIEKEAVAYSGNLIGSAESGDYTIDNQDKVTFQGDIYWYGYGCGECYVDSDCVEGKQCINNNCGTPFGVTAEYEESIKQNTPFSIKVNLLGNNKEQAKVTVLVKDVRDNSLFTPVTYTGSGRTWGFSGIQDSGSYTFEILIVPFDSTDTVKVVKSFQVNPRLQVFFRTDVAYFMGDDLNIGIEFKDKDNNPKDPHTVSSEVTIDGTVIPSFIDPVKLGEYKLSATPDDQGELVIKIAFKATSTDTEDVVTEAINVGKSQLLVPIVNSPSLTGVEKGEYTIEFRVTDAKGNLLDADFVGITVKDPVTNEFSADQSQISHTGIGTYSFKHDYQRAGLWLVEIIPQKLTPFEYTTSGQTVSVNILGTDVAGEGIGDGDFDIPTSGLSSTTYIIIGVIAGIVLLIIIITIVKKRK